MNKRHVLLLTAVLGMASFPALAQVNTTSATASISQKQDPLLSPKLVTINTGSYRGPLSVLLAAVAKSAGYEIVFNFNVDALALVDGSITSAVASGSPEGAASSYASALGKPTELSAKPITYNFVQRPFNEVWPLLMDVYELQYEVVKIGNGEIIRIGQRPAQLAVPLRYITAKYAEQKTLEFFGKPSYSELPIYDNSGKIVDKVRQFDRYVLDSGSMRILADAENNRLIAGGTAEETAKIRSFVATIDIPKQTVTATPQGEIYYTVKGNAVDVVNVLKAQYPEIKVTPVGQTGQLILSGSQIDLAGAQNVLSKVDAARDALYQVLGNPSAVVELLKAQYPNLVVTPIGKSSQLRLSGTQVDIDSAQAILKRLDVAASATTVQRVFQLVNASAEEVKATLEGTLQKEVTTPVQQGTGTTLLDVNGNPISALVPPSQQASADAQGLKTTSTAANTATTTTSNTVNIIADKRTNTLVVRGTPLQVEQIAELIPQLDKVVPQINVQVRIQELTDEASRNLGLNANLNFGGFTIGTTSANGISAAFDPTRTFMGFNIFPTLTAYEKQALAKRVYDGNVTMQSGQRSLGGNGQTENASSNAAATVKSGGSLEINIPSQAANIPSIQKTIDYGVILDFFNPQVAPDGTITIRVRGRVNTPPQNIAANAIPYVLDFKNSEAQSIVTFKSGETLLLAGLMGNSTANTSSGVPFLSKFGVGGTTGKANTFSQLLVIITGTVVK